MRWRRAAVVAALLVAAYGGWRFSYRYRPQAYLDLALTKIEENALKSAQVDWPRIREHARRLAVNAKRSSDTYPAIRFALKSLNDNHSTLFAPGRVGGWRVPYGLEVLHPQNVVVQVWPGSASDKAGIRPGDVIEAIGGTDPSHGGRKWGNYLLFPNGSVTVTVRSLTSPDARQIPLEDSPYPNEMPFYPAGHRIGTDIGYLDVRNSLELNVRENRRRLSAAIERVESSEVCGWIVDLRRNFGGNMWPALQALRPILGDENPGFTVGKTGRTEWAIHARANANDFRLHASNPPVAVLTSHLTGSAGEATAVAFRGRDLTRTFGESTGGRSTSNEPFRLPDGALMLVATALNADRTGKTYEGRIAPDEPMAIDWRYIERDDDPLVTAASAWLRSQPACRRQ
jgi:C-terminal processing protease CtpA/Prc